MKLIVSSPLTKREYSTAWIEINVTTGNMVIQPGHAPMIARLAPDSDVVIGLDSGKKETLTVVEGVVHITRTEVLLLLASEV